MSLKAMSTDRLVGFLRVGKSGHCLDSMGRRLPKLVTIGRKPIMNNLVLREQLGRCCVRDDAFLRLGEEAFDDGMANDPLDIDLAEPSRFRDLLERCLLADRERMHELESQDRLLADLLIVLIVVSIVST